MFTILQEKNKTSVVIYTPIQKCFEVEIYKNIGPMGHIACLRNTIKNHSKALVHWLGKKTKNHIPFKKDMTFYLYKFTISLLKDVCAL